NQATVTDNPDTPTDYSLYVVDNNGCASLTATASVTLSSGISLNVTASPMEICLGESSILSFSIFGGVNPVVYMVDGNPASSPQSVSPLETTTYSVSATDACGSVASQDITIGVFDVPQFSFTASSTEGCSPLSVQFSGDNLIDFQSVHWNFGDGDSDYQSSLPYPVHLYEIGGVFDVSLTVQTALGCVGTITIPDMITVYNNPIAQFDADPNTITNISSQVDFFNESLLATSYLWDFGDEETSVDENPFHEYYDPAPGTITVTLVAYSNQNCTDTARVTLKVKGEYTLFMPNSFTPDGDGINDKFAVKGSGISNDGFKMTIYNRWGEVIYYSTDLDAGWNGRLSNGEKAEQGTYTWQVSFYEIWGKGHLEIGKVTLIR
ncbi:MAG: gliding motility-associated C-terminal domain-containing protein, partial [Bacteroidetes bacterium]|nr:gliding motility-associated C-terminal domain-containing protein [Bacteroidota bacterium]